MIAYTLRRLLQMIPLLFLFPWPSTRWWPCSPAIRSKA